MANWQENVEVDMSGLIMGIISDKNRCSKVPGVRIEPVRSSSRRGEFGRSGVEHKERTETENTSFNRAPPSLTEDWDEGYLVSCCWFVDRSSTTQSWTTERSFQSVLRDSSQRCRLIPAVTSSVFFSTAVWSSVIHLSLQPVNLQRSFSC